MIWMEPPRDQAVIEWGAYEFFTNVNKGNRDLGE